MSSVRTAGCAPTSKGGRCRRSGGKLIVTDGQFTEWKEMIGGCALREAKSKEEAIKLTRRVLEVAGEGECEIRQIATAEDFGAEFTPGLREQEERMRVELARKS